MGTQMQQRRGTAAQWASINPILGDGEIGFEEDTKVFKIGDGITHWVDLGTPYIPKSLVDAKGDLLVGTADNTVARLGKGATNQRLTVNSDGSLGWVDMPDLSVYETSSHASTTYETKAHAASSYETVASAALEETLSHAAATYETIAHAAATYAPKFLYAAKAADTGRTNTGAVTSDPDLQLAGVVNGIYTFKAVLFVTGDFSTDILVSMNGPAGSIFSFTGNGPDVSLSSSGVNADGMWRGRPNQAPLAASIPFGTSATSAVIGITLHGRAVFGATAGNMAVAWGQNTPAAGLTTTIMASSFFEARKVN